MGNPPWPTASNSTRRSSSSISFTSSAATAEHCRRRGGASLGAAALRRFDSPRQQTPWLGGVAGGGGPFSWRSLWRRGTATGPVRQLRDVEKSSPCFELFHGDHTRKPACSAIPSPGTSGQVRRALGGGGHFVPADAEEVGEAQHDAIENEVDVGGQRPQAEAGGVRADSVRRGGLRVHQHPQPDEDGGRRSQPLRWFPAPHGVHHDQRKPLKPAPMKGGGRADILEEEEQQHSLAPFWAESGTGDVHPGRRGSC